jgi:hypothetical protein
LEEYIEVCTAVFNQLCLVCTLRSSELKLIANNLTQLYYEHKLTTRLIGHYFRLLDAGLQERTITPYLYFIDNNKNDSVKVLFTNNKWPFAKGMTLVLWVNALKKTDCKIFWLKTEDGNELILKVEAGKVIVECVHKGNSKAMQPARNEIKLRFATFQLTQSPQ